MKNFRYISWILSIFAIFSTYAQTTDTYVFPKINSNVNIPITIPLTELNRLANESIKGVIYRDNSYTDNDNDQFKTIVEKDGNIQIKRLNDQTINFSVPLKIWAEQGYGAWGKYVYQETSFKVVMNFTSQISALKDWRVQTKTKSGEIIWNEKPVLDFNLVKIPITPLVESPLKKQQDKFCAVIDQQIQSQLDLKPYLLQVWNYFAKPIEISPEYNTWLKITPLSLILSPLKLDNSQISTTVGININSETFTGLIPPTSPTIQIFPNGAQVNQIAPNFKLQTTANIPYTEMTKIAESQFLHKKFTFRDDKNEVVVDSIKMYPDQEDVMIEIHLTGDVKGIAYIKGEPVYQPETQKIVFTNTKFRLKTGNILQKTASLLFQKKVTKMIEEEYGIPLADIEMSSKKSLEDSFNQEYYKGIKISGKVNQLKPSAIIVYQPYITAIIDIDAQLKLLVSGLSF